MGERYSDDELNAWLDELLCEYVDGAMDPSMRSAFEEFLVANPDVAHQARAMVEARMLLCSCRVNAPSGFQQRIRSAVYGAVLQEESPRIGHGVTKLGGALGAVAGLTIFLLVGVWIGQRLPQDGPIEPKSVVETPTAVPDMRIVDRLTPPLEQLVIEPAQLRFTPLNVLALDPVSVRSSRLNLSYDRRLSVPIADSGFTTAALTTP